MGHGAAQLFAQAGNNVRIQARRESSLEKARELMTNSLKIMVEKEMLDSKRNGSDISLIVSHIQQIYMKQLKILTLFLNQFRKFLREN